MESVIIIGAGPIGLNTALHLKDEGWQVRVLEEHPCVGEPINCSGLVSVSGLKALGIEVKDSKVNEIFGAKIFSPNGNFLEVKKQSPVALVVDRKAFDQSFYRKAVEKGIEVELNARLINVRENTVFYKKRNAGTLKKAKIIIGADGVQSKLREIMQISVPQEYFVHAYQEKVLGEFDERMVEMHLGNRTKGFFAWIIPHSKNEADIGVGVKLGINPKNAFDEFVKHRGIKFKSISKASALIPVGPPLQNIVKRNMLLVGDAAFQTKALSGGGIILGLEASKCAAKAVSSYLKNRTKLQEYQSLLKPVNKELRIHWKIRSYLNSLSDDKIDSLIAKAKRAGLEEFLQEYGDMDRPSKFIPKILKKPKLWSLLPEALKFVI